METGTSQAEAGRMDRHYRLQRHVYDASRTHFLLGRMHLIRGLAPPEQGSVLEIGCGTAWNLVQAAKLYPSVRLHGVDISAAMLETAEGSLARRGLEGRVLLRQGDGTCLDAKALFGRSTFDRVYFSYALSMIPAWREALTHAMRLVAPGGSLHVVDFGTFNALPAPMSRGLQAFLAYYTVTPRADLEAVLRVLAASQGFGLRFEPLCRTYASHAVLQR